MARSQWGQNRRGYLGASVGAILVSVILVSACATASTTDNETVAPQLNDEAAAQPTTAPILPIKALPLPTPITIPPTPTPLPLVTRTLLFSGDVLSHTPVIARAKANGSESAWAYDYRPMFGDVQDRVSRADLAICVLETPVSPDNTGLDGYPTFNAPRELADALVHAGYDGCATASNHSMDRGPGGVRTTLNQMDRVSLGHAGMARSVDEANVPRSYDLAGVTVAHLSYTYGLNGFVLPDDEPWLVNVTDVDQIIAEANRAADVADFVVLSIQWGNEYQRTPSAAQELLAHQLTASGVIDLIIGNHAHVVQPVTIVNNVPVVYGVGNSLSNQSDNCCRTGTQDGVMIEVTVEGNGSTGYQVAGMAFAPTWVDRSNYTIIDLVAALDNPDLDPATRSTYEASMKRTIEAIHLLGQELPLSE